MTLLPANSELEIFIRKEINENLNTRDSYLQAIKEWLLLQPHLPDTLEDIRLLNFLRGSSFSLEKCKKKLDEYFTVRSVIPEFFSNRNFKNAELLKISKMIYHAMLPNLTKNGRRVHLVGFKFKNKFGRMEESMKLNLMIFDLHLLLEETATTGDVYVMDAEMVSMNQFVLLTPTLMKKFFMGIFEANPVKVKEIHVINNHPFVNTVYSWVKPFIKKKMRDRIYFHTDGNESLYKFVPKEDLPEEYGGNVGKIQELHDLWMQKLAEYEPWFTEQEKLRSDESKRPGKPMSCSELFGAEGSFNQLNLD